ncbi:MAG TPA: alpha/beta hydrolase [Stenomitos sp.]
MSVQSHPCFISPIGLRPHLPLFVFLPGMDGTGQLLHTQTQGLEAGFDVRCLAIPPDDLTGWDELTEKVVALIEAEMINRNSDAPIYVCGESFGGCLALKVALHSPQLVQRLILVNPASSFKHRPWMLWGGQIIRWFPTGLYEASSVGLLPVLAALERIAPRDQWALLNAVRSVPKDTSVWRLSLLQSFSLDYLPLKHLIQPTLVIASGADRLLPSIADGKDLVRRLPNAEIFILPHSGHACLLEEGVNLYEILQTQNFLEPLELAKL